MLEPSTSARSSACPDSAAPMLDLLRLDSTFSSQSRGRAGLPIPTPKIGSPGFSLLVLDLIEPGPALLTRSPAHLDLVSFAPDFLHPGSSLLMRSHLRIGSSSLLVGVTRMGPGLLPLDFVQPGPSLLLRSMGHLELFLPALGWFRPRSPPPASDPTDSGSAPSMRSFARLGSSLFVLDLLHPGFVLLLQGPACLESIFPVLDLLALESSPSPRSHAQVGLFFVCSGLCDFGPHVACSFSRALRLRPAHN